MRPFASLVVLLFAATMGGCASLGASGNGGTDSDWLGTWGTAVQLTEPRNLPPVALGGTTLRQVVRPSVGGDRVRLHLSNRFGDAPIVIGAVRLAASLGEGAIDPATDAALSFGGRPGVTIPPGGSVVSDPLDYDLPPRTDLAVTMHVEAISDSVVTGHPGSRTTSYIVAGDAVSAAALPEAERTDHWYGIEGLDVERDGAAVAILGDSITDGRGSTTNAQNRWPDVLAARLGANPATEDVAVLNMGIGGNCVLRACLGPAALDRFDRDVLERAGVEWLVILEGVNDIGGSAPDESAQVAQDLIAAYGTMIDRAHAAGIRVYGATITPFGGSFYDSPEHEAARQTVNAWIRTSGAFDAVIDLDAAIQNPDAPTTLLPAADDGDGLHPSVAGHRMMAEAVDLDLFTD
ncbi:SGNH/GDSL hydrolase family protein [Rubrivirga marina]|uniref:GDSL family lipase n=1 Tax=Rubrivirga marina TaxID=1196024 RepID=A0A271IWE2_9BACT|nr:SGNH/GDSL hydrolase family protein [Rubrivirga marina]PAP75035.1 GDSL family lipase [Rubrivirga marina]